MSAHEKEGGEETPAWANQDSGEFALISLTEAVEVMRGAMPDPLADRLLPRADPVRQMATTYYKSPASVNRGALPHRDPRADWSFSTMTCGSKTKLYIVDGWESIGTPEDPRARTICFLYDSRRAITEYSICPGGWEERDLGMSMFEPDETFDRHFSKLGKLIGTVAFRREAS